MTMHQTLNLERIAEDQKRILRESIAINARAQRAIDRANAHIERLQRGRIKKG
ncbi:MAG: hypothetical protein OEY97_07620 [Nitrospirota bacterium]|nr:hypothetical protein [Nitrospirota bacterium]